MTEYKCDVGKDQPLRLPGFVFSALVACQMACAGSQETEKAAVESPQAVREPNDFDIRRIVTSELPSIDGERLDYVCPMLIRPALLENAVAVIHEVARVGGSVETNLITCVDYSISENDRPKLEAVLRKMECRDPKEERVRQMLLDRMEHPNLEWP